jgi:hypothetical protein
VDRRAVAWPARSTTGGRSVQPNGHNGVVVALAVQADSGILRGGTFKHWWKPRSSPGSAVCGLADSFNRANFSVVQCGAAGRQMARRFRQHRRTAALFLADSDDRRGRSEFPPRRSVPFMIAVRWMENFSGR